MMATIYARSIQEFSCKIILFLLFVYHTSESKLETAILPDVSENFESCQLPTGGSSYCVPEKECNELQTLFQNLKEPVPVDINNFLAASFRCGKQSDEKYVCCPFEDRSILLDGPRIKATGSNYYHLNIYTAFYHISKDYFVYLT